ncbi:hypothetical protein [Solibacillus sp. FSL W7-1324]|uniref:hypothetical protein n=1 Tax=Solibacillus sp. FSL W7-1324 TaxID=2921701 RepID=UPI0030F7F52E
MNDTLNDKLIEAAKRDKQQTMFDEEFEDGAEETTAKSPVNDSNEDSFKMEQLFNNPTIMTQTPQKIKTQTINNNILTIDPVSRKIFGNENLNNSIIENSTTYEEMVATGYNKDEQPMHVLLTLNFDEEGIKIMKPLSIYERRVHDVIVSLYAIGNTCITIPMIYRALTQSKSRTKQPTEVARKKIEDAVDMLSRTRVKINVSEEMAQYKDIDRAEYEGTIIAIESLTIQEKGHEVRYLRFFREPILLTYSRAKKQVVQVDQKYFQFEGNKGEMVHVLAGYLMYRIQYMQRVHKSKRTRTHRTILFSTIYKQIKYTQDKDSVLTKRKMLYYRTLCNDILKTWQNLGLIREFTFHKEKNEVRSIIIELDDVIKIK